MRKSEAVRHFSEIEALFDSFRTVVDIVRTRALLQPNGVAYKFLKNGEEETATLTYQQLDRKARACGAYLNQLGLTGQRALLLLPAGPEFIEAFFGCLYAGVTAVPAYSPRNRRGLPRIQAIAEDANATTVITTAESSAKIQSLLAVTPGKETWRYVNVDGIPEITAATWIEPAIEPDTLAFLQYTSGSTGSPKGVMVSHGNILRNEEMIRSAFQHTQHDSVLGWLPLFHDMGLIGNVLQPLYMGIPSILMSPAAFLQKPIRWLRAIAKYRATTSGGPNFAYELCLRKISPEDRSSLDLSSWRVAFNGAEPVRADTLEAFSRAFAPSGFRRQAFLPCYGMAEATLMVSGGPAQEAPVIVSVDSETLEARHRVARTFTHAAKARPLVGCGGQTPGALPGQRLMIVNPETCTRCEPHEVGEIWVAGPHVAMGYWNRSAETTATFKAYTADTGEGPFLRTGDLGFLRNGELIVTGRLKDLIIIRGRNLYPQDIERTAERADPALAPGGAAAFSVEIEKEQRLVVVQELAHRQKPDLSGVLGQIRQAVTEAYEAPLHAITLIKPRSLPKTSSGKVQRQATRERYLAGELKAVGTWCAEAKSSETPTAAVAPKQNEKLEPIPESSDRAAKGFVRDWLIVELSTKLGIPPMEVDIHQPFTYYGLASVEGVALAAKLEELAGRPMPLSLVWDHPTIDAVSDYVSQG